MDIGELIEALDRDVPGAIVNAPPPPAIEEPETLRRLREEENREQIGGSSLDDRTVPELPVEGGVFEGRGRRLTKPQADQIDDDLRQLGFDAVAWYVSFHWNAYHWGIFLSEQGIRRIFELLADDADRPHGEMRPLAAALLKSHEEFHFHVDVATAALEIALRAPMYVPRYRAIASKVGYDFLEESLANACAYDRTTSWGHHDAVRTVLRSSPPGYCDFEQHLGAAVPEQALGRLSDDVIRLGHGGRGRQLAGLHRLIDWDDSTGDTSQVPVWLVHDSPTHDALRFVTRISELVVSRRFEKDLAKAEHRVRDAWDSARRKLECDATDPGPNFEKVKGQKNVFTIRLDLSIRARLVFDGGTWTADRLGSHDVVYGMR